MACIKVVAIAARLRRPAAQISYLL